MKFFNISSVRFSGVDKTKNIKIPNNLSPELAEDIGNHVGDGSLYLSGKNRSSREFSYSCHVEEIEYLENFIIPLKKQLYNVKKIRKERRGNEYRIRFHSLAISDFYSNVLGLPIGHKSKIIDVPKFVLESDDINILKSFIRGIVDTDFSLCFVKKKDIYSYPVLKEGSASKKLVVSLVKIFNLLGFYLCSYEEERFDKRFGKTTKFYVIQISGVKNLEKYVNEIGFHNPKHHKKFIIWKTTGECIPVQKMKSGPDGI